MDNKKDEINVKVKVTIAYTEEVLIYESINSKIYENSYILLNDILEEIVLRGNNQIDKSAISLYDEDLNTFIYIGTFPLESSVKVHLKEDRMNSTQLVHIKSRPFIKFDNLMRMNLLEEENDNNEENQNFFINKKSKRSKERKINYIIEKVLLWRKLYNGVEDEKGNTFKLTLEESAEKVGISKKSLDDYLIQIRNGKQYGFNFNEHKNDKVGILRAFVKKHKANEEPGKKAKNI